MTEIEMNTDMARLQSENLGNIINKLIELRKTLISQSDSLRPVWQSNSSDEFQELQQTQMNILWSKIQTLIGLRNQLNAAISIAEETDQRLAGG